MTGVLLKHLNAVFFMGARKPGVGARNGFTLPSPQGALQPCTERYSEIARGIRKKGHFFAGSVESLQQCDGGAGQLEEWRLRGGWQEFLGNKFSWQEPPSLPSYWWDSVCQLITKSPTMFCAETQGRIRGYLPGLLYYYKLYKVQHCGSKCPILCWYLVS